MKDENKHLVEVRDMTIDDIAPVFHLGEKLFTLNRSPNLYRTWDEYEIIDFFQTDSEFCISAFVDEMFAGFILGTMINKRHSRFKYGYLVWIGVDQNFKRLGVAAALFEELKRRLIEEDATTLIVDTQANNEDAINFFKNKGFGEPQDHIYLTLNLPINNKTVTNDGD